MSAAPGSTLAKLEAMTSRLRNMREDLKAGAKIGAMSLLTVSGGVVAGWCYADPDREFVPNTTFPLAGALGSALSLGALAGLFDTYSDQAAAVGAGLLSVVVAREAEKYFKKS
jgi:hypothetical protein